MKQETRKAAQEAAKKCYKQYTECDVNYDNEGYFYLTLIEDIFMDAVEWAMEYNGKQGSKAKSHIKNN